MADCKIIYTGDKRTGVIGLDNKPSETFQEILNNGQVKDFDEALQIYKGLYSDKIELPKAKVQNSGFFSNAEQSLLNLKDKNVKNVQGWMKALTDVQKNGGIKNVNQELEWIGLEDYLNEYVKENNPKAGNIPSSVVEEYIKSNQIEIVDVSKVQEPRITKEFVKPKDYMITEEDYINKGLFRLKNKVSGLTLQNISIGVESNGTAGVLDMRDGVKVTNFNTKEEAVEYILNTIDNKEYYVLYNGVDVIGVFENKNDAQDSNAYYDLSKSTKYSGYQLKGAENYREVLLTMPSKKLDTPLVIPQLNLTKEDLTITTQNVVAEPGEVKAKFNYSKNTKVEVDKALNKLDEIIEEDYFGLYSILFVDKALSLRDILGEGLWEYEKEIQIVEDNFVREEPSREEVVVLYNNRPVWNESREDRTDDFIKDIVISIEQEKILRQASIDKIKKDSSNQYKSSHWDEANILAHVRMNEKTLPDGRRVLVVNEIQADISQDLKKEQDKILDRVDKEFDNFLDNLIMNKVIIEEC